MCDVASLINVEVLQCHTIQVVHTINPKSLQEVFIILFIQAALAIWMAIQKFMGDCPPLSTPVTKVSLNRNVSKLV